MKYKCLILDHDDTAVNSTAVIHYPAHVEFMKKTRPDYPVADLETWFEKNFDPGIMHYLTQEVGLNPLEMEQEVQHWQGFTESKHPSFYPGFPELLGDFVQQGGIVTVVSHSPAEHIRRHYEQDVPGVSPLLIFGWENDAEKRKPSPWPVLQILEKTGLNKNEVLVVDDLKPGIDMARAAGVPAAAAGWGHAVPSIQKTMKQICDIWLADVAALRSYLFGTVE